METPEYIALASASDQLEVGVITIEQRLRYLEAYAAETLLLLADVTVE